MLHSYQLKCLVTYISNTWETEYMYIFTSNDFSGDLIECNEGDLQWVEKENITKLNVWEGDKIFLEKIQQNSPFFTLKLEYNGEKLVSYHIEEY